MQVNVIMQTLHYVLALDYNNTQLYQDDNSNYGYYDSLMEGFNIGTGNTSCPFGPHCFDVTYPWKSDQRPVALVPDSLKKIQPKLLFYTGTHFQELDVYEIRKMKKLKLTSRSHLVVVTHGFLHSGRSDLMKTIVTPLTEAGRRDDPDLCVMVLDWKLGSRIPYAQAVANTRIVGLFLGYMLELLSELTGLQMQNVHLIGHSLGAHLVGYAGRFIKQVHEGRLVGRITGMDPAGPYFRGTPNEVRIDASDAHLVVNLHTDSTSLLSPLPESLGITEATGHFDFYPDGGGFQTSCKKSPPSLLPADAVAMTFDFVACSHQKPFEYLSNSVEHTCQYIGIECDSWDSFMKGKCWDCRQRDCYTMGYKLQKFPFQDEPDYHVPPLHKKMFLATPLTSACGVQIRVRVHLSQNEPNQKDFAKIKVKLFLRGSDNNNALSPPKDFGDVKLQSNLTIQWVEAIADPGELRSMLFTFKADRNVFRRKPKNPHAIKLHNIRVDFLHNFESVVFDGCDESIEEGENKFILRETLCDSANDMPTDTTQDKL